MFQRDLTHDNTEHDLSHVVVIFVSSLESEQLCTGEEQFSNVFEERFKFCSLRLYCQTLTTKL